MPVIYWILNNYAYNPSFNQSNWEFVFRGNIRNVTDELIPDFLSAIAVDKVDLELDLPEINSIPKENLKLQFYINFDEKVFISSFYDIATEDYLPDGTWKGKFDDVKQFVPDSIRKIFW
jgi:hypothetical protein